MSTRRYNFDKPKVRFSYKPLEPREGSQVFPISPKKAQQPLIVSNRPHWVALAPLPQALMADMGFSRKSTGHQSRGLDAHPYDGVVLGIVNIALVSDASSIGGNYSGNVALGVPFRRHTHKDPTLFFPGPNTNGIPEIMVGRIVMFIWSLGS